MNAGEVGAFGEEGSSCGSQKSFREHVIHSAQISNLDS